MSGPTEADIKAAEEALIQAARLAVTAYLDEQKTLALQSLGSLTAAGEPDENPGLWRRLVGQYIAPVWRRVWGAGYASATGRMPERGQYPEDHTDELADQTAGFMRRVRERISTVFARSEEMGAAELRAFLAEQTDPDVWNPDTYMIGRTSAINALNAGALAGGLDRAEADGRPWAKAWIATPDHRTRHWHRQAHGQTQPIKSPFRVGGERLQYPGDPRASLANRANCRCALLMAPVGDPTLNPPPLPPEAVEAAMHDPATHRLARVVDPWPWPSGALTAAAGTGEDELIEMGDGGTWSGPILMVNTWSADGRQLALAKDAEIQTRPLPLPVTVQYQLARGHDGAQVGLMTLDSVERRGNAIWGTGRIDIADPAGEALARKIREGFFRFVSADIDNATEREVCTDADGAEIECPVEPAEGVEMGLVFDTWRIMGATLLAHPAFPEAHISMTATALAEAPASGCYRPGDDGQWVPAECDEDGAVPAAELPADADVAVQETAPAAVTEEVEDAADDANDTPDGDDPDLDDICAVKDADGVWAPSPCDAEGAVPVSEVPADQRTTVVEQARAAASLTAAAAAGWAPPAAAFRDPKLTEPTLFTVTPEGRVYGHVALWNTRHVSFAGQNIYPPHSPTRYERFHMKPIPTDEGLVEVGPLCMDTDHAKPRAGAAGAVSHYDSTGSIVAAVRCGEDQHGIWLAGHLMPYVTDEQKQRLSLAAVSGDWRDEGKGLDLKAVLAVPAGHEGFYTPKNRPTNPEEYALVASGTWQKAASHWGAWNLEGGLSGELTAVAEAVYARVEASLRLKAAKDRTGALAAKSTGRRARAALRRATALAAKAGDDEEGATTADPPELFEDLNWVDDVGGLPAYIDEIRKSLQRTGMPESRAIATAVAAVKRWCAGAGDVKADTRAKACAAVADWERKKAQARAT